MKAFLSTKMALILGATVLVVGSGVFVYALARDDNHSQVEANSGTQQVDNTSSVQASSGDNTQDNDKTVSPPTSNDEILAPLGSFVSNHHPSLSKSATMQSTCTTSAGATCHITFTKSGTTQSLEVKTADSGGNVTWTWRLQDINLTEGEWKITAIATKDGKSKTTEDNITLEIRP